jgi:outer membrane immunogenic protein
MTMKRMFVAALVSGTILSPVFAADMPVPAAPPVYRAPVVVPVAYSWTGFYVGINGGAGWARENFTSGGVTLSGDTLTGPLAGGQIGFNYQIGMLVLGAEFDGQWASISKTVGPFFGVTFEDKITGFITGRGRIGMAVENFMVYATGGGMYGWAKSSASNGVTTVSVNDSQGGWTAGGGAEWGLGAWSIKAEYLYLRTNDRNNATFGVTTHVDAHVIRAGLNYRIFGGGPLTARF